jgi:hypothetical protein
VLLVYPEGPVQAMLKIGSPPGVIVMSMVPLLNPKQVTSVNMGKVMTGGSDGLLIFTTELSEQPFASETKTL